MTCGAREGRTRWHCPAQERASELRTWIRHTVGSYYHPA